MNENTDATFTATNKGYAASFALAGASQALTMLGHLVCGLFQNSRWLPPGSEIKISRRRSPTHFRLDNKDLVASQKTLNCIYESEDTTFYAARRPVSNRILQLHESLLNKGETIKYVCQDPIVKTIHVPAGISSCTTDGIIVGKIPQYLVIALNKSSALAGKLNEDAFRFDHYNLKNESVHWSADSLEQRSLAMNFSTTTNIASDSYLIALNSFNKAMPNEMITNGITRESYKSGQTFLAFELLPRVDNTLSVNRRGTCKISLDFREPLAESITVIIYMLYQSVLEIDRDRQVTVE